MLAALCVAAAAHAPAAAPGLNCSLLRGVEPPAAAPAFRGEFGWEMVWAGNMFFLWACNRLRLTRSCGPLRALYFFSPHHTSVRCSRGAALPNARQTPWRAGCERWLSAPGCQSWLPVPLQMYWERRPLRWPDAATRALPLVVLFNKKYREWGSEAVNFIDEQTLNATLAVLVAGRHRVAYRRMTQAPRELRTDWHAQESSMDDARIVASHPREMVRRLDELAAGTDFNEAQMRLLAEAGCVVTVQGGSEHLAAAFGGHHIIFHRKGPEDVAYYPRFRRAHGGATHEVVADGAALVRAVSAAVRAARCRPPKQPQGGALTREQLVAEALRLKALAGEAGTEEEDEGAVAALMQRPMPPHLRGPAAGGGGPAAGGGGREQPLGAAGGAHPAQLAGTPRRSPHR